MGIFLWREVFFKILKAFGKRRKEKRKIITARAMDRRGRKRERRGRGRGHLRRVHGSRDRRRRNTGNEEEREEVEEENIMTGSVANLSGERNDDNEEEEEERMGNGRAKRPEKFIAFEKMTLE